MPPFINSYIKYSIPFMLLGKLYFNFFKVKVIALQKRLFSQPLLLSNL